MTTSMLLDYVGIMMDKHAMSDENFAVRINVTDTNENYLVRIQNGVLLKFKDADGSADAAIRTTKLGLSTILAGNKEAFFKSASVEGETRYVEKLITNLNQIKMGQPATFNIVEP